MSSPVLSILLAGLAVACLLMAPAVDAQSRDSGWDWEVTVRQLEWQDSGTGAAYMWDLHGWVGSAERRLWIRNEGGRHVSGAPRDNRLELLWGNRLSHWSWMDAMDLEMLIGIRHDSGTVPSRTYVALGVAGTFPFGIRFEASSYLGDGSRNGDSVHSGVRAQLERGWELTPRAMLVLRAEHEVWNEDHVRYSEGTGPWMWSAGARLHWRFAEGIAPYVGVEWFKLVGDTASQARAAGEADDEYRAVAGLRLEFGR